VKTKQECSSAAGLQDQLMGKDEHAGFGEKVGIDMLGFNDGKNLAIDQVEHLLPGFYRNCL
jgi:hypothetical protein